LLCFWRRTEAWRSISAPRRYHWKSQYQTPRRLYNNSTSCCPTAAVFIASQHNISTRSFPGFTSAMRKFKRSHADLSASDSRKTLTGICLQLFVKCVDSWGGGTGNWSVAGSINKTSRWILAEYFKWSRSETTKSASVSPLHLWEHHEAKPPLEIFDNVYIAIQTAREAAFLHDCPLSVTSCYLWDHWLQNRFSLTSVTCFFVINY